MEANAKETQSRRIAGMQEKLVAIAEYLSAVDITLTGKKKADNLAWAALAAERGWSAELTALIRGAREVEAAATTSPSAAG